MENSKKGIILLLILVLLIIQVSVKYEAQNTTGEGHLFPRSLKDVRRDCQLFMTPVDKTYTIWPVLFTWQFLMVLYSFTTVIRNCKEAHIATPKFYYCYIGSVVLDICLPLVWTRSEYVASLAIVCLRTFLLFVSFGMSCYDFYQYQKDSCTNQEIQNLTNHDFLSDDLALDYRSRNRDTRSVLLQYVNSQKKDLWCYCGFIQNGVLFYASWSFFETIHHFAVVLNQDLDASNLTSSITGLTLLLVCLIVWFFLENFRLMKKFTMYTVATYVAFTYAIAGVYDASWDENRAVGWLSLILLFLSVLMFDVRILAIGLQHHKNTKAYRQLQPNGNDKTENNQIEMDPKI